MKKIIVTLFVLSVALTMVFANGATETTKVEEKQEAVFAGGWPYSTPPTGHFNMFVSNAIELKYFREIHQLPLATYVAATDTYVPMLAESWKISEDGSEYVVTLRKDAKWLSGENFTAKDVWTTFMMYKLVGNAVWNYIDSVTVVDDNTVSFGIKTPTTMINRYILRKPMVDYKTYGEYADRFQTLINEGKDSESAEYKNLQSDFSEFRPTLVNATGPWYINPEKVTASYIEMEKNPNSFLKDTVTFDKIIVYNGDVPELSPLVLNGEIDYLTHQFPGSNYDTFTAMGYDILQLPGVDGIALYINEDVYPLGMKEVRQALAYVIDRERVGALANPGVSRGTKYITGLGDNASVSWCDESLLIDYSHDEAKASALLESVGFTKKNGQWFTPEGKQFTLTVQSPASWSDASVAADEVAQQLTAFGIKTVFVGIDSTMRQSNINDGSYELALSFFGTAQPHPMFAYETPLLVSNANAPKGLSYPMIQNTERYGEVNVEELIYASTTGWDTEAQREIVEKLIVTVNETVPYIPLYTKWSKNLCSNGFRTTWEADDSIYMNSPGDDSFVVIMLLNGKIRPL